MDDEFLADMKQVVADPAAGPKLSDLVHSEASRLISALSGDAFDPSSPASRDAVIGRLDRYVAITGQLVDAMALGARWSGDAVRPIWASLLERVVGAVDRGHGQAIWADLSLYPGVLMLYASGVGALAGARYDNLRAVLLDPRLRYHNEWRTAVEVLYASAIMDPGQAIQFAGLPNTFAPLSDRLAADLRPLIADVVPDDSGFDRLFDRFEYLLGLIYVDVTKNAWGPTGRFVAEQYGAGVDGLIGAEIVDAGATWPPLVAGLFGGSPKRLEESLGQWRKLVDETRRQARFHRLR